LWVLAATPKDLRSAARPSVVVKILVAATLAAACLWVLRERSLLIGAPVAAIVYSIAALALGVVPASDLRAVGIFISRVRPGAGRLGGGPVASPGTVER
jgi:hypothetical protein